MAKLKKEKKSKFKISLNPDGCEPPASVKAKKPFWRPNKGPKILIASGENEETAAKRKKKEKDKKRLKKKGEEAQVHETQGHNKAVRYLTSWAEDRQNWKFEKCRQIWLVQNCYDPMKIPDAIFPTLVEYMNSIRGKMREVALERAKDKMESMTTNSGITMRRRLSTPSGTLPQHVAHKTSTLSRPSMETALMPLESTLARTVIRTHSVEMLATHLCKLNVPKLRSVTLTQRPVM